MMIRRFASLILCLLLCTFVTWGKDKKDKEKSAAPAMVMLWPDAGTPTLKLTFERFTQLASYNGQLSLESHVLIENLSGSLIQQASFTVYMLDKDRVRVGNGTLNVSDLDAGQQAKISFQVFSVGIPASLSLVAKNNAAGIPTSTKTVPLKVVSVPPGANLRVDGHDVGTTPTVVNLMVGSHTLEFSKEGFNSGSTPVDIKSDEAPGGSISFELGGLSHDVLELRDGKMVQGDAISMSMTSILFRINGKDQSYERNQVKKIILVQRETVAQTPVVEPAPAQPAQGKP